MDSDEERFRQEIFVDKVYGDPAVGVVIDIGAHVGLYTEYCHKTAMQIYSVEPSLENFKRLKERTKKMENVKCFNLAIGLEDQEERNLYGSSSDGGYSIRLAGGSVDLCGVVKVQTLKTFMDENNIEIVDLLKVDCEGAENEIFVQGFMESGLPQRIKRIVGENHYVDTGIFGILQASGYIVFTSGNIFEAIRNGA